MRMKNIFVFSLVVLSATFQSCAQNKFESDVFETSGGKLTITFLGHASLMINFNGKVIQVDPVGQYADYSKFPKADLILITHNHFDHFDQKAIEKSVKPGTVIVLNQATFEELNKGQVMKNGDVKTVEGIKIEAVPAYNTTPQHLQFHPRHRDNGYVLTFGNKRVYIAGDTEDIPEMAALKNIDVAFLPMNQPYTMLPSQVVQCVHKFHPHILYPYHYGNTNVSELTKLMANDKTVEVRIRKLN